MELFDDELKGVEKIIKIILDDFKNTQSVVIDLRFNGGGYETVALQLLRHFVTQKKDILSDIEFLRNFESYVNLLKHHNVKEEKCFFRVCELCLSQAELDQIYANWVTFSL